MKIENQIQELYDQEQNLNVVLISPELWAKVKDHVLAEAGLEDEVCEEPAEPIEQWEMLIKLWDFDYPVNQEAHCDHCGAKTDDFLADDPRKFLITSANMAGLLSLRCQNCNSKITKRHFKDHIDEKTYPFAQEKSYRFEAKRPAKC